ncbi:MAG: recombinase family protein [Ktedonobacteraceae bacterium]
METPKSTAAISWEYLMPKRKERMAGYIRESDPTLATSTTIESAAKAIADYGSAVGYIYEREKYEYREAISAYEVPWQQRKKLLAVLDAARRKEFDVLVVTEIRALGRRQVEVLVIYDMLLKYGVRLETIKEKFGEDAMSKAILGLRAMFSEIEREQSYMRMQRGKMDRALIGQAPITVSECYTHILVDTNAEVKGRYELNDEIVYSDENGIAWTRLDVVSFMCDQVLAGFSLQKIVIKLNNMGISSPRGSIWSLSTVASILQNPILYGEVYTNRYKQAQNTVNDNGKRSVIMKLRPQSEWIRLPNAPSVISHETFDAVQEQMKQNRRESLRNNRHPEELGLLRAGYITCGICGSNMFVLYPSQNELRDHPYKTPRYVCQQRDGGTDLVHNHRTQIHLPKIEQAVKETIIQSVSQPALIRKRIEELLATYKKNIDTESIRETLSGITASMKNLYKLAEHATTDETIADLATRMNQLETQKRQAEAMLSDLEDEEEIFAQVEKELRKFEEWTEQVRPFLADPSYTPTYEEMRLAVQILGIHVTLYPSKGDYPFRYQIEVRVPQIVKGLVSTALSLACYPPEWNREHKKVEASSSCTILHNPGH